MRNRKFVDMEKRDAVCKEWDASAPQRVKARIVMSHEWDMRGFARYRLTRYTKQSARGVEGVPFSPILSQE